MQTLILTLHLIVCVLLVVLILLQSGKEGMGVIFGGGNSSVFGSAGAGGILAKLTALMGVIFVITSLSYTYVTSSHEGSESQILDVRIEESPEDIAPATPSSPAAITPEKAAPAESVAPDKPATATPPATEPTVQDKVPATPQATSPATESPAPETAPATPETPKPAEPAAK
ncbi:MAG: preprotein translocase subunit SecG [Desulfovibrio sp.]|nr:preprotein translocase subunit SecG [Desulfovibrio sp.]